MRLLALLFLSGFCFTSAADSWIRLNGQARIVPADTSASVNWKSYATWGPETERDRTVTFNIRTRNDGQPTDFSLAFTMAEDGWIHINPMGPWQKTDDRLDRIDVVFSGLDCIGAELKNGSFDNAKEGVPAWWNAHGKDGDAPFRIDGGIVVWHNGYYSQTIRVRKNTVVTLRGKTRMAEKADYAGRESVADGEKCEARFTAVADGIWKPVDMTKMSVIPGSALDFSRLHEPGPAGKYGRAIITRDGDFAFEKRPDEPVRFFAFNAFANHLMNWGESMLQAGTPEETRANIREFAAKVRRQGYNMVRFQGVDLLLMTGAPGYAEFNPANLNDFQYMLHCLKEEGVYFGIDLFSYTGYEKFERQWDDALARRYKERMYFDPEARNMWLDGVRALMTGKNPYTGLSLNEEPALVYVDLHNEQELGIWVAAQPLTRGGVQPAAEKAWRDFLARRYGGDVRALEKSWNAKFDAFDAVPLFVKADLHTDSAKGKDANDFLYEHEREMLEFYRKGLEAIGCRTFATLYDVLGYFRFVSIRREVPVITAHGYHNHPSNNNNPGSRMAQNSINSTNALYFRYMAPMRVWNRPFLITEYNAPFWGRYRHQEGLILPAYAALQDYAGITAHSLAVSRISVPLMDFQIGRDPVGRAGQVIAAFAYGRGDVAAAKHKVGVALSESYLRDHRNMNRGVNADQNRIALLTGFGVVLDGKIPAGLPPYPALDWLLPPAQGSEIVAQAMFTVPVDRSSATDFAGVVKTLREKGILPPGNRTDAETGLLQCDTGEITMDTKANRFTVDTPRLQGAAWEGGTTVELSGLSLKSSLPCTAALISLDGRKIGESALLLLVFSTDALNSGMELAADRSVLYKIGTLPVLLETGKLELSLKQSPALRCFALGVDGERLEELPVKRSGTGLAVAIDTAKLKKGPSLYFEFAER